MNEEARAAYEHFWDNYADVRAAWLSAKAAPPRNFLLSRHGRAEEIRPDPPLPPLPASAYPPDADRLSLQWRARNLEEQLDRAAGSAEKWRRTAAELEARAQAAGVYQRRAEILRQALADLTALFVTDDSGWARSAYVSLDDLNGWLALAEKGTPGAS